ncbi:MAG: pyridoxal-phosphate-dependent aminotransferase family protein [Verrucomicrobiales bacterium]
MSHYVRLYIPGPIEVSAETFAAMSAPMIGHRSKDFQALYAEIQPMLRMAFATEQAVYLSTSSAWGIMEGSIRNLVARKVLNCGCGAFSDKWYDVSLACGKEAEVLKVEWGRVITPEMVEKKLHAGGFDALTLVHNETSTGVMNPVAEIAQCVKARWPEVMIIVDTVSSFSAVATPLDSWGVDVILSGSQKALALPPGLSLFTASAAAMGRAASINSRGYYFDFLEFAKNGENNMTPSTPCLSLIYGLRHRLKAMLDEGLENRYRRHAELNELTAAWVRKNGFAFFAPEGFRSPSLTCVANNRAIDVSKFTSILRKEHRIAIDGGYGKIKGKTFRVSNMGDETRESMSAVLAAMDDALSKL